MNSNQLDLTALASLGRAANIYHTGFVLGRDIQNPALSALHKFLLNQCDSEYMNEYLRGGLKHWSRKWEYPYILGQIACFAINNPGHLRIFDNACGVNATAYLLASAGFDLTGTDLNDEPSAEGDLPSGAWGHPDINALKGSMRFLTADSLSIPFDDDHFDVSYSISSLEHMPDPFQAVKEMIRVTRPGGLIAITMDVSPRECALAGESNVNFSNFTLIQGLLNDQCRFYSEPSFYVPDELLSWQSVIRTDSRLRKFLRSGKSYLLRSNEVSNFYIFCGSYLKKPIDATVS